ncbi:MAG: TlpA family protein disulfide reductase [Candidatus Eremiobacteraeota bacterium]|nr:TlpA family protein disulfide reductase [Candidatus Eremiobacteraeota bacterium]
MDKAARLFGLAFLGCSLLLAGCAHPAKPVANGVEAPDFTQPLAYGGTFRMQALRGKPVYLNFFATWCGPCKEEAPAINALQKKYAKFGLTVVGVDILESAKKAREFQKQFNLVYPIVVDGGTVRDQYAINGLPVHAFITRDGIIKSMHVGEMSSAQIEAAITAIL